MKMRDLTFGEAMELVREGKRVTRSGYGLNCYVYYDRTNQMIMINRPNHPVNGTMFSANIVDARSKQWRITT